MTATETALRHRGARRTLAVLMAIEVVLALVLVFADAGFDKSGGLGLDFGGVLLLATAFVGTWLGGQILALWRRAWWAVVLQCIVLAGALAAFHASEQAPAQRFDAADYQNLVGFSRSDVEREIGTPRGATEFTLQHPDGDRHELRLPGMTIVFTPADTVLEITPNDR